MQKDKRGTVTLIGAGCGKGFITLKGYYALQNSEVVVYDDLIDKALLDPLNAEKIYVGKRRGQHSRKQEEINQILIDKALEGKRVARLKGGDSFVFGRGGEEILALQKAGIAYDVIAGVTSAVAVPETLGIPVTHRGAAQSFTVVTGHTTGSREENYEALANLDGTLIFLMGLYNIDEICSKLIHNGKDKNTPASLLSDGFGKDEKRINGTLDTIAALSANAKTPAVLVIGKTAGLDFRKTIPSVTVTGTKAFCEKFCNQYSNAKAYPTVTIVPQEIDISYKDYEWLAFTGGNAIEIFFEQLEDVRQLAHLKFACVGCETAKKLEKYKIKADFVPSSFDSETMLKEMPKGKVLVLGNDNIYKTKTLPVKIDADTDYIVFSSASGVRGFFENGSTLNAAKPVCIGRATAKELSKYTNDYIISKVHTIDGIIEVIQNETFSPAESH